MLTIRKQTKFENFKSKPSNSKRYISLGRRHKTLNVRIQKVFLCLYVYNLMDTKSYGSNKDKPLLAVVDL